MKKSLREASVSALNIISEVGLKEKPEDTRYIQIVHQNETRSTGSVGKLNIVVLIPNFMPLLGTVNSGMGRPWEKMKSIPRGSAYHRIVGCIDTPVQRFVNPLLLPLSMFLRSLTKSFRYYTYIKM